MKYDKNLKQLDWCSSAEMIYFQKREKISNENQFLKKSIFCRDTLFNFL